jgi:hypothetical protein
MRYPPDEMTSLNQLGWMAMGFGAMMANTSMVIVWPGSNGTVVLSQRKAPGLVEPTPDPSPSRGVATLLTHTLDVSAHTRGIVASLIWLLLSAVKFFLFNRLLHCGFVHRHNREPDLGVWLHTRRLL